MVEEGAAAAVVERDMEVQVVSSTVINTPGDSNTVPSTVPFTVFDKFACDMHVGVLYAFAPPTPTNAAIKDGLARTLVYFPTLTGQLGVDELNRPSIHVGGRGAGALLVEATVATALVDHLPFKPSRELLRLHPPTEEAEHVFQVQLNRFRCGGVVVGATAHHRVADAQSMSNFFIAWGKSTRGLAVDPPPVYDCRRWMQPRCPPRCEFQHWGVEFVPKEQTMNTNQSSVPTTAPYGAESVQNISLHYSTEFIEKTLKAQLRERYTTFETLLAHLWRKITLARGLTRDDFTEISVAVNGRRRVKPPLPPEFFGNMVLHAHPRAWVKELVEGDSEGAARLIHDAVSGTGDEYFRSFVDFGAMHEGEDLKPIYDGEAMVLYPNLEADSWLGFRFNDLDFGGGGGGLCAFAPTWIPAEGVIIFVPSPGCDGGVDVFISLFEEHARSLRKISHSLQ